MSVRVLAKRPPVHDSATVMRRPACRNRRTRRAASVWISMSIVLSYRTVVKGLPSSLAFLFQSPEGGLGLWSSGYDTAFTRR